MSFNTTHPLRNPITLHIIFSDRGSTPSTPTLRNRRQSVEFEDLNIQTRTGKILPPLAPSLHSCKSSSRLSTYSGATSVSIRRADSLLSLKSTASTACSPWDQLSGERREVWAGDPEAISSVRRPRKTLAQQRVDAIMTRSNSAKDGTRKCFNKWRNLSRSSSVKDIKPKQGGLSRVSQEDGFSHRRSRSLKEKSVSSLGENLSTLDLGSRGLSPRHGSRPNSSMVRTMRWLSKHPGSPISLDSSMNSLPDGSSSGESIDGSMNHLIPRSPAPQGGLISAPRSPLSIESEPCALNSLDDPQPARIQQAVSQEPTQSMLFLRRRLAKRGGRSSESPPQPGLPSVPGAASLSCTPPQQSPTI